MKLQSTVSRIWTGRNATLTKQAVKTGIAGVLCLYVTKLLRLPEGYWAAITAVVVIQSNVGATISASRSRLIGTAIGAMTGSIFVVLRGSTFLGFGIAVTVTVLICSFLGFSDASRLAGVTVAIVMLVGRLGSPWIMAFHRFIEVSVGIVVAMLVTAFVWPSRASEILRRSISVVFTGLASFFQVVLQAYRGELLVPVEGLGQQLEDTLRNDESLLQQSMHEPAASAPDQQWLALLVVQTSRLLRIVESLELAAKEGNRDTYHQKFEPELGMLVTNILSAFHKLAGGVTTRAMRDGWTDFSPLASQLDEKAAAMHKTLAPSSYNLQEILRFYSILLSLKNLARELDFTHQRFLAPRGG